MLLNEKANQSSEKQKMNNPNTLGIIPRILWRIKIALATRNQKFFVYNRKKMFLCLLDINEKNIFSW
jgi:hypothetical protein